MNASPSKQNARWLVFVWFGALLLLIFASGAGTLTFGLVAILVAPILIVGIVVGGILLWRRYRIK